METSFRIGKNSISTENFSGRKLNNPRPKALLYTKKPSAFKRDLALFFGLALLLVALAAFPRTSQAGLWSALAKLFNGAPAEVEEKFPVLAPPSQAASVISALEAGNSPPAPSGDIDSGDANPINIIQENSLLAPLNPVGTISNEVPLAGRIFVYTIRPGDTLSAIAKSFDVTVNTILWANNIQDFRALKVGDQLVILPVSGVRHEIKKGDTLSAIAKKYRAGIDDILQFNGLAPDEELAAGAIIIIPNGELAQAAPLASGLSQPRYFSNLPLYEGFYIRPIIGGRKTRGIHGYNGVDLANSCGLPVMASADGRVIVARPSGWNGGYGRYVVISHFNNTQTLYSHLKDLIVSPGQVVRQGEVIATIGSSGNSTGCHLHFEVRGARNPF